MMYPRNHQNSPPPPKQLSSRRDDHRRQTSAPPSQIVYASTKKNNGVDELNMYQQRPPPSLVHPSHYYPHHEPQQHQIQQQSWYYVGPKGTATGNNRYENNGIIRYPPTPAPVPYYYLDSAANHYPTPPNTSFINSSSLAYPVQHLHHPPISTPSNIYYHHPGVAAGASYPSSFAAGASYPSSLDATATTAAIMNSQKNKSTAASNRFVVCLSVSVIMLVLCLAGVVALLVTQPSFLLSDWSASQIEPQQPQQQQQLSSTNMSNKSQLSVLASLSPSSSSILSSNNQVQLTHQDDDLAQAFKTTPTPASLPVLTTNMPQLATKDKYYEFIEAFKDSVPMPSSSTLSTKPKPTPAPSSTTTSSSSAVKKSPAPPIQSAGWTDSSSPLIIASSTKEPSPAPIVSQTKTPVPAASKPLDSGSSSSLTKKTRAPAPITSLNGDASSSTKTLKPSSGYYYYYYDTLQPVKKKDQSPSDSNKTNNKSKVNSPTTTSKPTKGDSTTTTATSTSTTTDINDSLASLMSSTSTSSDDDSSTSTSSDDALAALISSTASSSDDDTLASVKSSSSSSKRDGLNKNDTSTFSLKVTAAPTPSPAVKTESSKKTLPGTLLGAIDDDTDKISVYGNANTTIPCDLLMCDDITDDDGSTNTGYGNGALEASGGVIYSDSDDGMVPDPYATTTMTSSSAVGDDDMVKNPIEKIVGVPITQNSNNQDDGFCSGC